MIFRKCQKVLRPKSLRTIELKTRVEDEWINEQGKGLNKLEMMWWMGLKVQVIEKTEICKACKR